MPYSIYYAGHKSNNDLKLRHIAVNYIKSVKESEKDIATSDNAATSDIGDNFDPDEKHTISDITSDNFAIIVTTAERQGSSYLARCIASLHTEIEVYFNESAVTVNICHGDEKHKELDSLFPLPSNFKLINTNVSNAMPKETKYIHNFLQCVENTISDPNVHFILTLEDDIVLMDDFFSTVFSIIKLHERKLRTFWLDIKLYKNPRLRGWAFDTLPLVHLLATSALLGMAVELLLIYLSQTKDMKKYDASRNCCDHGQSYLHCFKIFTKWIGLFKQKLKCI